jgi:transcriptional regulator
MPMLDFRVETFLAVCRHMNFTKAARELNITQPAVSHHMHYLSRLTVRRCFSTTASACS